jgi:hypothetical protein
VEKTRIENRRLYTATSGRLIEFPGLTMRALWIAAALTFVLAGTPAFAAEPVVAVWYRGTPAGTPRLDDLAAIRAAGFGAITWPSVDARTVADVSRLAEAVGLTVVIQPDGRAVPSLEGRITVDLTRVRPAEIPAIAWRAVARGARIVSFDPGPGEGSGLDRRDGRRHDWVAPAVAIARQLAANAELLGQLRHAATPAYLSSRPSSLDVELFEGVRAWVIIATNTGRARARAQVALPRGVPYAIWVSLVDASTIAMLDRPDGARWTFEIGSGAAVVYVIDKVSTA